MKAFKKAFRKQLIILPIIALMVIIGGIIVHEVSISSYQEISKEEFVKKAFNRSITDYNRSGNRLEMETPDGKKYFHQFKSASDQDAFGDSILDEFGSYSWHDNLSFYEVGIPITIGIMCGILLFNMVVILWFVSLFDLLKSEFEENHNKWIWFLCLLFLPLIAPLFYMLISANQKRKPVA